MNKAQKQLNTESGRISSMFNGIAPHYDKLNHILSLNVDKYWRGVMVKFLKQEYNGGGTPRVLDLACGTGDSSIALCKKGMNVTGADIAQKMLDIAIAKNDKINSKYSPLPDYILASAEDLPFEDSKFDATTISFGIRNFNNRPLCLKEIYRVIKPGGVLAILEFAKPKNAVIRFIYNLYFNNILPFIGRVVSKDKEAYKYLSDSVEAFPKYNAFCTEIKEAGFKDVKYKKLTFGICVLYTGKKQE